MNSKTEWKIVERMMLGDFSFVKDYNENHDPGNGQFTSGGGTSHKSKVTTPKAVVKAMMGVENDIRLAPVEHGVCYDKDGKELFHGISNSATEYDPTPEERSMLKDAFFSHNHGSDKTFSPDDINMAMQYGSRQFRACGKSGAYILTRQYELKDQTPKQKMFDYEYSKFFFKHWNEAVKAWREAPKEKKTKEWNWELRCEVADKCDQWLKENATDYGWEYEVKKL